MPIKSGVTYVASYHTTAGYTPNRNYFATAFDSPPLRALADGEDGGNAPFIYDKDAPGAVLPAFPSQPAYQATNYWVDVIVARPGDKTLARIEVSPNPASVATQGTRQFTARAFYADGSEMADPPVTWMVDNGGGTISATGLFTAGAATGTFTDTIVASLVGVRGTATVAVMPRVLDHFDIATVASPQHAGVPFGVSITARDTDGLVVAAYSGTAALSDLTGTVTPTTATFTNGTWTGSVTIGSARSGDRLTAADGYANGQSNAFDVTVPAPQYSLWDAPPSTGSWNSGSTIRGTRYALPLFDGRPDHRTPVLQGRNNNSAHVGHLWTNTGTLLATAAFTNETASGWQTAQLSEPVAITKDTSYVVSYHTISYRKTEAYFASQSHTNGPLTALQSGVLTGTPAPNGNGLYAYGTSAAFPNDTYMATNYGPHRDRGDDDELVPVAVAPRTRRARTRASSSTRRSPGPTTARSTTTPTLTATETYYRGQQRGGGTVSLVAGTITFVPTANLCEPGPYGFDYTVSDGKLTDTGHVAVTITCVDDAPTAVDDTYTDNEDTTPIHNATVANDTNPTTATRYVTAVCNVSVAPSTPRRAITFTPTTTFRRRAPPASTTPSATATDTDTGHVTSPHPRRRRPDRGERHAIPWPRTRPPRSTSWPTTPTPTSARVDHRGDPARHTAPSITGGGTGLTYTPNANYFGTDSFTYTAQRRRRHRHRDASPSPRQRRPDRGRRHARPSPRTPPPPRSTSWRTTPTSTAAQRRSPSVTQPPTAPSPSSRRPA